MQSVGTLCNRDSYQGLRLPAGAGLLLAVTVRPSFCCKTSGACAGEERASCGNWDLGTCGLSPSHKAWNERAFSARHEKRDSAEKCTLVGLLEPSGWSCQMCFHLAHSQVRKAFAHGSSPTLFAFTVCSGSASGYKVEILEGMRGEGITLKSVLANNRVRDYVRFVFYFPQHLTLQLLRDLDGWLDENFVVGTWLMFTQRPVLFAVSTVKSANYLKVISLETSHRIGVLRTVVLDPLLTFSQWGKAAIRQEAGGSELLSPM